MFSLVAARLLAPGGVRRARRRSWRSTCSSTCRPRSLSAGSALAPGARRPGAPACADRRRRRRRRRSPCWRSRSRACSTCRPSLLLAAGRRGAHGRAARARARAPVRPRARAARRREPARRAGRAADARRSRWPRRSGRSAARSPSSSPAGRRSPSRTSPLATCSRPRPGPALRDGSCRARRSCCSPSSRTRTCCSPTRCSTPARPAASPCCRRSAASRRSRPRPCRSMLLPRARAATRVRCRRAGRRGCPRPRRRRGRRDRAAARSSAPSSAASYAPIAGRSPCRTCSRWRCSASRACSWPSAARGQPRCRYARGRARRPSPSLHAGLLLAIGDDAAGRRRPPRSIGAPPPLTAGAAALTHSARASPSARAGGRGRPRSRSRSAHRGCAWLRLATRGLWLDEAISIHQAQMPLGDMLTNLRDDRRPPAAPPHPAVGDGARARRRRAGRARCRRSLPPPR